MPVLSAEEVVARCRGQLDAGQVSLAVAGMTEAYEAAARAAQWSAASWTANWIGHVYEQHVGDLTAALAWFATAARTAAASEIDLPRSRATAEFNAGLIQGRRGRTTAALGHLAAARTAAASSGDAILEATCGDRLGAALAELGACPGALAELGRAERIAAEAGQVDLARSCAEQAAEIAAAMASSPGAQFARLARAGLDRCLAAVRQGEPGRVLDAGCGSGPELLAIAERWPRARVVGVDRAQTVRSIRIPRHLRGRVVFRAGDLTVGTEGDERFDVAVCHAVLHDVDQPAPFLAGLARALRPGGEVVGALFSDTYCRELRHRLGSAGIALAPPGIRHGEDEIAGALARAGFTDVETWTESVALEVDDAGAPAHLERVLGRALAPGEGQRLLDAIGRPLRFDLSPLSFIALAGAGRREKPESRVDHRPSGR